MNLFIQKRVSVFIAILIFSIGCASGSVIESPGPSVKEARAVSATGPKARIAVAQFVNNSGGLQSQLQRAMLQIQAQSANLSREMMEYQKKMAPYWTALADWQARVQAEGREKAGPPPKAPQFRSSSSPYMATVTDPVAGGVRDMVINALFNSGKFIVVERQAINAINWEQDFSRTALVGQQTRISVGQVEGAELLLLGSLTTLDAEQSGASAGAMLSTLFSNLAGTSLGSTDVGLSWTNAKAAMELRLVDVKTSRVVAAATVEGKATSVGAGTSKPTGSYYSDPGPLPATFKAFHNTPVEQAMREMVHAAVKYLVEKTPEKYVH